MRRIQASSRPSLVVLLLISGCTDDRGLPPLDREPGICEYEVELPTTPLMRNDDRPSALPDLRLPEGIDLALGPQPHAWGVGSTCTAAPAILGGLGRSPTWCAAPADEPGFDLGCRRPETRHLVVDTAQGPVVVKDLADAAALVAPVDQPEKALGLAALAYPDVLVPATDHELRAAALLAETWRWLPEVIGKSVIEIHAGHDGYTLRLPAVRRCGCEHTLYQISLKVDRDGTVCPHSDEVRVLARARRSLCVD